MRLVYLKLLLICFISIAPITSQAKVTVISVQTEGTGLTKKEAISDAIVQAISQVNGAQIAAKTASSIKEEVHGQDNTESYSLSEKLQRDVKTKTKGIVESWKLLSSIQDGDGLWLVSLNVQISKFKSSKQLKRLRMAVTPFRIAKNTKTASEFEISFTRQLQNYLTQTRRFAMLDREFLEEQSSELDFIKNGGVQTRELAKLGNRVGTDYLIVGEVEDAIAHSTNHVMQTTGKTFKTWNTSGRITFRIIDVATSQIKYSDTISISLAKNAISQAANELASQSGEAIVNAIFPVHIVAAKDGLVTLGQGGVTIQKGREYKVIQLGERMIDPYTKESIGREETVIGEILINDVQAKSATAEVIAQEIDISSNFSQLTLIVRPVNKRSKWKSKQVPSVTQVRKQVEKEADEALELMEEESKDDW